MGLAPRVRYARESGQVRNGTPCPEPLTTRLHPSPWKRARRRAALLAGGDAAVLLAFAAIGRANHGEPLAGALDTALPFIAGGRPP